MLTLKKLIPAFDRERVVSLSELPPVRVRRRCFISVVGLRLFFKQVDPKLYFGSTTSSMSSALQPGKVDQQPAAGDASQLQPRGRAGLGVLLGVSGSVAAVKLPELLRTLAATSASQSSSGAASSVRVTGIDIVLSQSASRFLFPDRITYNDHSVRAELDAAVKHLSSASSSSSGERESPCPSGAISVQLHTDADEWKDYYSSKKCICIVRRIF